MYLTAYDYNCCATMILLQSINQLFLASDSIIFYLLFLITKEKIGIVHIYYFQHQLLTLLLHAFFLFL